MRHIQKIKKPKKKDEDPLTTEKYMTLIVKTQVFREVGVMWEKEGGETMTVLQPSFLQLCLTGCQVQTY